MRIAALFLSLAMPCGLSVSSVAQAQTSQPSPRVVAQISRIGQTASISQRTLFTPQKDGVFRLSVYLILTSGDNNSNEGAWFYLTYTDDVGPELQQNFFGSPGEVGCSFGNGGQGGSVCTWTSLLRAKAGTPITWQTSICPTCSETYEVFATLEKLQPLK